MPTKSPETPAGLAKHPLVAAMSDPAINVGHAADLLALKASELSSIVYTKVGGIPPELQALENKARECQFWAHQTAAALHELQEAAKPGIEVVGAMPQGLST